MCGSTTLGEPIPNPMPPQTEEDLMAEARHMYSMARREWTYDREMEDRVMRGSYDVHQHAGPDVQTRVWDEVELTVEASEAGMAAVVFKNHVTMTSGRAAVVTAAAQKELELRGRDIPLTRVVGGVVLNHAVGALNPAAVEASIGLGGRFVWLPSFDSQHHHHMTGDSTPSISVLDDDGGVVPPLLEILDLIAANDQVLSLCHLSVAERYKVIDVARDRGVDRILVDHPLLAVTKTSIEEMQVMAKKGAMLGFYVQCCLPNIMNLGLNFQNETLRMITDVGVDHLVAGTDLGQPQNARPVEGMRMLIRSLMMYDISEDDLVKIFQTNPASLVDA